MQEQQGNHDSHQPGDKVRIRFGPSTGARGVIRAEVDGRLEVLLDSSSIIHVASETVTNYSLAARRAWQAMPKRAGRPQLPTPRKKMVSMRLDVDVWDRLGVAVDLGLIPNREQAVNAWIRQQVDALFENPTQPNETNTGND